ncbi:transcriptional regulator PaaX [Sulfolobus sp. B1]|uniref:PaaX family transcriptional regulator n=1 Tax=Sulfolobus sp. B1 TaxID=2200888 RepID=UPI00117CC26B|nr:PaaX family transcriptional regulator C-terminal domain-containing protein [Sulfolobus sp. B1]TRM97281.1 transcriptional regulator PaaX [Sulfolobus sp. B1]
MKIQSLFFTIYGDYIKDVGDSISLKSLIRIFKEFGFSEGAVRAGMHRMKKRGLVITIKDVKNKKISYKLSQKGMLRLSEGTKRVYEKARKKWDGKWRIVVYNIPEGNRELRDKLRKELRWLGFGMLTQSTWISPNPMENIVLKFVEEINNSTNKEGQIDVFLSEYLGDPKSIVKKCWNLSEIEKEYEKFIEKWSSIEVEGLSESEAFITRINLVHEYRKFLNIDPDLPEDLLPDDWKGYKAYDLFIELRKKLTPKADKFFYSVYEP